MANEQLVHDEVFFKWLPEYSVNINTIDAQHQELVIHQGRRVAGEQNGLRQAILGKAIGGHHRTAPTSRDLPLRVETLPIANQWA